MRFEGRVAVVTGAAGGVGAECVRCFVSEGARVVATDMAATELARAHRGSAEVECVAGDITDDQHVDDVTNVAVQRFGGIDVLVNNAGVTRRAPLEETSDEHWDAMLDINLRAAFACTRSALPALVRSSHAAVVNVASINALRGNRDLVAYSAAKGGLVAMTRALAAELATHGVRVNAVCPGTVDTPMLEAYLRTVADPDETRAALAARHPLGRIATPAEVASAIAFLACDDASFITGVALPIDGGRHLG